MACASCTTAATTQGCGARQYDRKFLHGYFFGGRAKASADSVAAHRDHVRISQRGTPSRVNALHTPWRQARPAELTLDSTLHGRSSD
jgi:hypothetical protein